MKLGMVYLAGPVDQVRADSEDDVNLALMRVWAKRIIGWAGGWLYDPSSAFVVGGGTEQDRRLYLINTGALERADVVFALMPPGVASVGTPMEVQQALGLGKPVAVVGGAGWHMAGLEGERLYRVDWDEGAEGIRDAVRWLMAQDTTEYGTRQRALPVKLGERGFMPERTYKGDAGFDLFASEGVRLEPGQFVDIPCDVYAELPDHVWGMLVGRSSSIRSKGILVYTGIIDQGYRGELFAGALNVSQDMVHVERGERVAQLIPMPLVSKQLALTVTEQLRESDRGTNGFGSTGR